MPRVPVTSGLTVAENALPSVYERNALTPDLLSASGRQQQATAQAEGTAAADLGAIRTQMIGQANALRVDDALNQATEISLRLQHDPNNGFVAQTGYAALNRESGQPLADEYTGKLQEQVSKIAGTLGNDQQRQMFAMKANNIVTNFYGAALTHEATQQKEYNLSVRDATVTNAQNALTLNYTDPANVDQQVTRIRSAIMGGQNENGVFIPGSAQMQGKSAAWAKEAANQAISEAHGGAVKSALESGNVNLAMAYFKAYGDQMTAKDVLAVQGTLVRDYDARQGMTQADKVFNTVAPTFQPSDMDRLTTLVLGAESKGQRFAPDGSLLTSPKGAKGEMQVLDSTNKDPGYGVTPAKDDSPDERARVGRDYLAAMVKNYNGDVSKALAAYNAGPGVVDQAVKDAAKADGPARDWLVHMPAETQKYVAAIAPQFQSGAGQPAKPTIADLHDQVRLALGPNASPAAQKAATERITQRFEDQVKSIAQRKDEALSNVMRALDANGGKYSELQPSLVQQLQTLAPDKVDDAMKYAERIVKGTDTSNLGRYNDVVSHMDQYAKMSDVGWSNLQSEFSQRDFKHLSQQRQDYINGGPNATPGSLNAPAIGRALDAGLTALRIPASVPKTDTNGQERLGGIRSFVNNSILNAQQNIGRKMTEDEISKHVANLFATDVTFKGTLWGTNSQKLMTLQLGDLPSGAKEGLTQALIASGNKAPTDTDVLNLYRKLHVAK